MLELLINGTIRTSTVIKLITQNFDLIFLTFMFVIGAVIYTKNKLFNKKSG
ncbi:hypothetical protein OH460_07855 [Vibrio sp. Makdt]|uniref:hypothetical protein n=1 Tax=Vibrio sp. Makdt TaxID=2998828 RepID=UPI0022CD7532|nr:hypothetical protein [Vibrio sp. Makdt]MDA0152211.1 hypothetical protein [Vibrio sp. Makdt]